MEYQDLGRSLPKNLAATARAYLRSRMYSSGVVTHTASDLNEEHEKLMTEFCQNLQVIIQVRHANKEHLVMKKALTLE
jgi:hypothetical protein